MTEYHDGGYWYVLPVVLDEVGTRTVAGVPNHRAWFAIEYGYIDDVAVVCTRESIELPHAIDIPVTDVIPNVFDFGAAS